MECLASVLTVTFGTTRIADVRSTRRPVYSFLLQDKRTECRLSPRSPTGNQTRNLQSCGKVPQQNVPPHSILNKDSAITTLAETTANPSAFFVGVAWHLAYQ